jgi:hypothetical protein
MSGSEKYCQQVVNGLPTVSQLNSSIAQYLHPSFHEHQIMKRSEIAPSRLILLEALGGGF